MDGLRVTIIAFALAALAPACVEEFEFEWDEFDGLSAYPGEGFSTNPWRDDYAYQDLQLLQGTLQGTIGPVVNLDHTATALNGWDDGYFTTVEVTVHNDHNAAMAIVDIVGGLQNLEPGMVVHGSLDERGSSDGIQVYLTGCSGPQVGVWDYDEPAQEVVMSVAQGSNDPDTLTLSFTATLSNVYDVAGNSDTSVVSGSVSVVVPR